jgi:hypothetical protein
MTDTDTDALVEAMARAVRLARLLRRGYEPSEAESIVEADPSTADEINSARALLPIITAHTAAAVAAERERASRQARGAVVIYTKGYGPGDGDSAINQQENPND